MESSLTEIEVVAWHWQ